MKACHSVVVSWGNASGTQSRYLVENVPNVPLLCCIAAIVTCLELMCKHHSDTALLQVTWHKECEVRSNETTQSSPVQGSETLRLWRICAAALRVM